MGHRNNSVGNDRGDRASAVLAFIAALVVMVTLGARNALADVDWHEKGANMTATVGPWSYPEGREYALAEYLGYDWSSLSLQVRNDILNDSNGDNQFKQLLDHNVLNVQYESGSGALNWPVVSIWSQLFGLDKLWDIDTTNERYVAAQDVMKKYIYPREGEDDTPDNVTVGGIEWVPYNQGNKSGTVYTLKDINNNNTINVDMRNNTTYLTDNVAVMASIYSGTSYSIYMAPLPEGVILAHKQNETTLYLVNTTNSNKSWTIRYNNGISPENNGIYIPSSLSNTYHYGMSANSYQRPNNYFKNMFYYGGEATVIPPYVPTPDPTPTAPTITIGDVTVDLSNGPYTVNNTTYSVVYAPDNSWSIQVETHTDNQYGGNVMASDPTDYTSILNAILAAINALRSEMNTFNNQINANITTLCNSLNTSIKAAETELNGQLQTMQTQQHNDMYTLQTNLQNNFNGKMDAFATDLWANMAALDSDLIEEMDAVARYIVDSMDFGDTFSDNNIITWLKKIYMRLGSQPVIKNPTEDPTGWLDDLKKLLETILGTALAGVDTAALSTLWNTAKTHFPLSLPWDMLAIVGLLAHEPITPAVDYPIVYDGTTLAEIEFDLSDYEDVADISRKMSLIVFAMGLLITYPQIFHTLEPLTKALRG